MTTPAPMPHAQLMPLIELVRDQLDHLEQAHRADIFEGLHLITRDCLPELSEQAKLTCEAIRDAESSQLSFREMLNATLNPSRP